MILLNGAKVCPTKFPDGTSQVWKIDPSVLESAECNVEWKFQSEDEFMHLAQLKSLIGNQKCHLSIPFLPYARQDKEVSNYTTFALHTFAELLNSLNFDSVTFVDAHSYEALRLIRNSKSLWTTKQVEYCFEETRSDLVCYPDSGAFKKYTEILQLPFIRGEKVRDQLTGNIVTYDLFGFVKDKNVLVVDDICDGGMTFVLLAKALRLGGAKNINLFVSHGIFSKGKQVLLDAGISRIFTKDGEEK